MQYLRLENKLLTCGSYLKAIANVWVLFYPLFNGLLLEFKILNEFSGLGQIEINTKLTANPVGS